MSCTLEGSRMFSTTLNYGKRTLMLDGDGAPRQPNELDERYQALLDGQRLSWTEHHRFTRLLGSGGQGIVFLTDRRGADRFTVPVAVKIFSPERYKSPVHYDEEMSRIAHVAARIAQIQQDNLLDVQNFIDRNRIRLMEMEWIDGYDLSQLLTLDMLNYVKRQVSTKRWNQINSVVVTQGPVQARLKPGIAIAVIRECLAALAALHREHIVHGDVKPSNIMLKRTGNAKIIDIGSACEWKSPHDNRTCTPHYAAPEVLDRRIYTPQSDLASLGYVLVEMLSGIQPFEGLNTLGELLEAKHRLPHRLHEILPEDVVRNELLVDICRNLVAPDPTLRVASAEEAEMNGAASFHRQLIIGNLASEYENDIRIWLSELD